MNLVLLILLFLVLLELCELRLLLHEELPDYLHVIILLAWLGSGGDTLRNVEQTLCRLCLGNMDRLLLTIRVVMVLCDILIRHRASSLLHIDLVGREAIVLPLELIVHVCLIGENTGLDRSELLTAGGELLVHSLLADLCAGFAK